MEKPVTEDDAASLDAIREKVGPGVEMDFSYGVLTGLLVPLKNSSTRFALTTRDDDHPRGRGLPLAGWLAAIDESHKVEVKFSQS